MARVGFIGLGNMGAPMARNLVKAGHEVVGFDVVEVHLDASVADGVVAAKSTAEAVAEAEVVFSMLPAGEHVKAVYLGDSGIVAAVQPGSLVVDSSTIDVASAREVHDAATAAGLVMLDAPVSGGVAGAEGAALTFMCGGSEKAFEQAKPFLEVMGRNIVHAGGPGNGQAAKVCNNMILGITMIGISEAFVLAEKLGLDHQKLFDISSVSSGSCWAMLNHLPVPDIIETAAANRDYEPGFAAAMMHKDLKLSQTAASQVGAATPLGAEATALYTMFINAGQGGRDYSAIIKMLRGA